MITSNASCWISMPDGEMQAEPCVTAHKKNLSPKKLLSSGRVKVDEKVPFQIYQSIWPLQRTLWGTFSPQVLRRTTHEEIRENWMSHLELFLPLSDNLLLASPSNLYMNYVCESYFAAETDRATQNRIRCTKSLLCVFRRLFCFLKIVYKHTSQCLRANASHIQSNLI